MEGSPAKLHHAAAYADREDDHAPGNGISKALLQPTRLDDKWQKLVSEEGGRNDRNWVSRPNRGEAARLAEDLIAWSALVLFAVGLWVIGKLL
ncbi:hypothetical protein NOVOSPHI9U_550001 [Novosphingobium sp. 9U]|nr:hypothetical protein NOVOSPHI9U_550001 [Novosphingobium sp. 9U]